MEEQKLRAPAVTAAIKLIEYMSETEDSSSLADLSNHTGLNKNMLSRVLSELLEAGWVIYHEDTGKYSLSLQLFRLGSTALKKKNLTTCAGPYLKRLNDLTGECIQLAVLYENQAVYIAQMESKKAAGIRGQIGASYSLDTTAPGKIFKAFVHQDPSLSDVRTIGYALDQEEYGRGVICIAAPVFDYTEKVIASINIASLTVNHTLEEMIEQYSPLLLSEAERLSRELGYCNGGMR